MSYEADGVRNNIDLILAELAEITLAQKTVQDRLDGLSGSILAMGVQNDRISPGGVLAANFAAMQSSEQIIQVLFSIHQNLTLQRDRF
jgi:hypothetical protein